MRDTKPQDVLKATFGKLDELIEEVQRHKKQPDRQKSLYEKTREINSTTKSARNEGCQER